MTENCTTNSLFEELILHQWCVEYILLQTCDFWELQKSKFVQYPLIKRILVGVQMFRYTLWLAAPFPLITLCIWCPNYVSITLLHWLKNHIMVVVFFPPLWSEDYLLVSVKAWADTKLIQILVMQHRCADLWWELRTSSFWVNFMKNLNSVKHNVCFESFCVSSGKHFCKREWVFNMLDLFVQSFEWASW